MSSQLSILDDPLCELTARTSWRTFVHPTTGEQIDKVIESLCGRYSILKTDDAEGGELFIAWRRRRSPQGRWEPPDLIGGFKSGDAAREACATHAEATNPYRPPFDRWSDEVRKAHAAMPTNREGMVINPRYLPSRTEQRAMTARWREWSRRFPAWLHPTWLDGWFAEASAGGLTT